MATTRRRNPGQSSTTKRTTRSRRGGQSSAQHSRSSAPAEAATTTAQRTARASGREFRKGQEELTAMARQSGRQVSEITRDIQRQATAQIDRTIDIWKATTAAPIRIMGAWTQAMGKWTRNWAGLG